METIQTRTQYLALFPSESAALDHEPTPDYWTWLAAQIETADA